MRPLIRYAFLILLFLISFLTATVTVRSLNPWSESEGLRAKLEVFAAHRDEYDALYLGSSHVYHAFQPEVIDPAVTEALQRTSSFRSFNLGMEGMFSFETDALLRELLTQNPQRLRWLIIEAPTWRPKLSKSELDTVTERNARWHDPVSTYQALRSLFLADRSRQDQSLLQSAGVHLQLLGLWLGNHGRGPAIWRQITSDDARDERDSFLSRRGYQALEQREGEVFELRQRNFLAKSNEFPARVAKMGRLLEKRAGEDLPMESYNTAALARQVQMIRTANLEVIYVSLPALMVPRYFDQLAREDRLPHYFDLRDPKHYPELWAVERRFDEGHLSEEGATILSRIFADRFADLLSRDANEKAN